jgi:hypothetical protein
MLKPMRLGMKFGQIWEKVKEYADMITDDPYETTHANHIRKAVDILTNVLQNIQKAAYPGLADEVKELKSASESIKPEVLTLNQKMQLRITLQRLLTFFKNELINL